MLRSRLVVMAALLTAMIATTSHAHFIWILTEADKEPAKVNVYFAELALPDDPNLLSNIAKAEAWVITSGRNAEPQSIELVHANDELTAQLPEGTADNPVVIRHTYGVMSRGENPFLIRYYAKGYSSALPANWKFVNKQDILPVEVIPELDGDEVLFKVFANGKPAADCEVVIEAGPGVEQPIKLQTDENGRVRHQATVAGHYSVRARIIEQTEGEHDGKPYKEIRHYSTVAFPFTPPQVTSVEHEWPELERGITSFGGAVAGETLYVYGGHYGTAHHYSTAGQSGDLHALNLKNGQEWQALAGGPKVTGLAMVAHEGNLYRIGGFTAKNEEGEKESLWSQDGFARFSTETGEWEELPALPEPRSSFDAAVLDNKIYVIGGWQLRGEEESVWHDTAWSIDLSASPLEWKPIATPPFQRRALSIAAANDKIYVIGGMQQEGSPTTRVDVYDPRSNTWSQAPAVQGGSMDGFGTSSFAYNGRLYATTMSGSLQRLSEDGSEWEFVGQLNNPRFFHRLLPFENGFVAVGGASMEVGKITELEQISVESNEAGDNTSASAK